MTDRIVETFEGEAVYVKELELSVGLSQTKQWPGPIVLLTLNHVPFFVEDGRVESFLNFLIAEAKSTLATYHDMKKGASN